jgi:hypothetical protein
MCPFALFESQVRQGEKGVRQAPKHVRQVSARAVFVSAIKRVLRPLADISHPCFRLWKAKLPKCPQIDFPKGKGETGVR